MCSSKGKSSSICQKEGQRATYIVGAVCATACREEVPLFKREHLSILAPRRRIETKSHTYYNNFPCSRFSFFFFFPLLAVIFLFCHFLECSSLLPLFPQSVTVPNFAPSFLSETESAASWQHKLPLWRLGLLSALPRPVSSRTLGQICDETKSVACPQVDLLRQSGNRASQKVGAASDECGAPAAQSWKQV